MSVSMTLDAVRDQTKTVTRRHVDTWKSLRPGDRLTLIEKGMGLPKGARQVVVAEVEILSVRVEPLELVTVDEVRREGLFDQAYEAVGVFGVGANAERTVEWFIDFWCAGHGYRSLTRSEQGAAECRPIEWRYLDARGRP